MIKIAHLSDTHIGYEAYSTLASNGENQRAVDFARAFAQAVEAIIEKRVDIIIHAGDVADRTQIPIRLMLFIRQQFAKLTAVREDGTQAQLVVVAGNHEIPRSRKEACFLELFKGMPGVHIVTRDYQLINFENLPNNYKEELKNVVIHALPHDALKSTDFSVVEPHSNKINILTSHGVAGGSELYLRSLGREYAIPTNVLARKWDYVALGHWHKQGPINLFENKNSKANPSRNLSLLKSVERDEEGFTEGIDYLTPQDTQKGNIWYSGSLENSGFGDLRDNGTRRGWLEVTLSLDNLKVDRHTVKIRSMFKLSTIDCKDLSATDIFESAKTSLQEAHLTGAIVLLPIINLKPEIWSLVDQNSLRELASQAMHFEFQIKYLRSSEQSNDIDSESNYDKILLQAAKNLVEDEEASLITNLALDALEEANKDENHKLHDETIAEGVLLN